MFWISLLLYLDTIRFFGAMLVVLKVMMKESLIFFSLLIIIMVGFLQAFVGMDNADTNADVRCPIFPPCHQLTSPGHNIHPPSNGQCSHAIPRL